ncbi:hypothetical protein ABHN11_09920, partial [Brevibacillus centrosporus]|uniref:hypothetical protein n=1 Tax=Brevibacillus centrosporus TaxID=54910 RepID=UPI003D1D3497
EEEDEEGDDEEGDEEEDEEGDDEEEDEEGDDEEEDEEGTTKKKTKKATKKKRTTINLSFIRKADFIKTKLGEIPSFCLFSGVGMLDKGTHVRKSSGKIVACTQENGGAHARKSNESGHSRWRTKQQNGNAKRTAAMAGRNHSKRADQGSEGAGAGVPGGFQYS